MATWTITEAVGVTAETFFSDIYPSNPTVITATSTDWAISGDIGGKSIEIRSQGNGLEYQSSNLEIRSGISDTLVVRADGDILTSITGMSFDWRSVNVISADKDLEDYFFAGNDTVIGNSFSNNLMAFDGDDTVHAGGGNDFIFAGRGSDYVDGGGGIDTAGFAGMASQFEVRRMAEEIQVLDKATGEIDILVSVERLQFDNGTLAMSAADKAGQALRLYVAALDRAPDAAGLGYHVDRLDSGVSLADVAGGFTHSPEFQGKYGALSSSTFVDLLYQNVLDRGADADGLAYHVARLAAGVSREDVLIGFSESPENVANTSSMTDDGIWYV